MKSSKLRGEKLQASKIQAPEKFQTPTNFKSRIGSWTLDASLELGVWTLGAFSASVIIRAQWSGSLQVNYFRAFQEKGPFPI
jgi:hypothetical protein